MEALTVQPSKPRLSALRFLAFLITSIAVVLAYDMLLGELFEWLPAASSLSQPKSHSIFLALDEVGPAIIVALWAWLLGIWQRRAAFVVKLVAAVWCIGLSYATPLVSVYFMCYTGIACI
jgi:hypothetical protein